MSVAYVVVAFEAYKPVYRTQAIFFHKYLYLFLSYEGPHYFKRVTPENYVTYNVLLHRRVHATAFEKFVLNLHIYHFEGQLQTPFYVKVCLKLFLDFLLNYCYS